MEVVNLINKNNVYVNDANGMAWNPEREIGIIQNGVADYDYAFKVGCDKVYLITTTFKALFKDSWHNDTINYIKSLKGDIVSVDNDFDSVMKSENLDSIMGNVRINRIIFKIKTHGDGRDCEPCKC